MTTEEKIFQWLEKLDRTMSLLYNSESTPPDGIIVRMEKGLNNHLQDHNEKLEEHLKNHKESKKSWGDKSFRLVSIIFNIALTIVVVKLWLKM